MVIPTRMFHPPPPPPPPPPPRPPSPLLTPRPPPNQVPSVLKRQERRRLAEVSLRSVKHHLTGEEVLALGTSAQEYQLSARIIAETRLIVRETRRPPPCPTSTPHRDCRYDACAVKSDDVCYVQSSEKWIDMSPSPAEYENFYGDLYDVHFFEPRQVTGCHCHLHHHHHPTTTTTTTHHSPLSVPRSGRVQPQPAAAARLRRRPVHGEGGDVVRAPQRRVGADGGAAADGARREPAAELAARVGAEGHARLRRHQLPGASPSRLPLHHLHIHHHPHYLSHHHLLQPIPPQYGCWTIVTPPWTDASTDFETGFDQNDEEKLECCVESTVRW